MGAAHFCAGQMCRYFDLRLSAEISGKLSTKGRQQHNVIFRYLFHGATSFAPGGQPAGNHVRFKSLFPEHMRHTGAGGFA